MSVKYRSIFILSFLFLFLILTISSCAPAEATETEYGFLFGIIHGFIFPFVVIGKIFDMEVGLYAINNSGTLYWIGYLIGVIFICSSSRAG